jgi:hypothetical protein
VKTNTTEIRGMAIMAVRAALGNDADPLLRACNLAPLHQDRWYPQRGYLELLRLIGDEDFGAILNVTAIGLRSLELIHMIYMQQAHERTTPDIIHAIRNLDMGWQAAHRGGYPGQFALIEGMPERVIVQVESLFPVNYCYGLLYGLARLYRPNHTRFMVDYAEIDPLQLPRYEFTLSFESTPDS